MTGASGLDGGPGVHPLSNLSFGVSFIMKTIMLLCCESCAPSLAQKLADALEAQGHKTAIWNPIADSGEHAIPRQDAAKRIAQGQKAQLLDALCDNAEAAAQNADVLIALPVYEDCAIRMAYELNTAIARNLDAMLVPAVCTKDKTDDQAVEAIELAIQQFAQEGFTLDVVASGCSSEVVRRLANKNITVIQPKCAKIDFNVIKPSCHAVTPTKFMRSLHAIARAQKKTIVLPEGNVDRVLSAAAELKKQKLVDVILLGKKDDISAKADELHLDIDGIQIVDPQNDTCFDDYANTLYELRKAKGMTEEKARTFMADKTFFGTMMVYKGRADGMVSGATTTTADTIRPALQFIKTKPGIKTVSGVFLMSLADRVYLYGDCAVIPNPTTDQLADVAVASAATARAFGLDPKIAMLSYSTGTSGAGPDVDAVREATAKAREAAPELLIEGPIQYDAAVDPSVARTKLPGSPVAGQANVFVFPTLNAGNIGYKAVQRASGAIAIGPLLQGLNKPVNDLSRGASVADIVNTVLVTAIQAQN